MIQVLFKKKNHALPHCFSDWLRSLSQLLKNALTVRQADGQTGLAEIFRGHAISTKVNDFKSRAF